MRKSLLVLFGILLVPFLLGGSCGNPTVEVIKGGNDAAPGEAPLFAAIRAGDLAEVKDLIRADPSLLEEWDEATGQAPLHRAIIMRQTQIVKFLIESGADVNAVDDSGQTPLDIATDARVDPDLIQLLEENGAE